MLNPSDLVLIEFPFSNLAQAKRRPALVVRGPSAFGDILAAAVTSKPQHAQGVAITQENLASGSLLKPSWVRCDQLHTFDQSLVIGRIATLTPDAFAKVMTAICALMGCRATDSS